MNIKILFIFLMILLIPVLSISQDLEYNTQVFDFGHIGIEFRVYNTYELINAGDKPIKIKDVDVSCDCSEVNYTDSIILPNDTAFFNLAFETKNYYGPVNKSFEVITDSPTRPQIEFFYLSIVGQWYNGLKPNPISLFFLAGQKSKTVQIPNKVFDHIKLASHMRSSLDFTVKVNKDSAQKGEYLEVIVSPSETLNSGTHHSSLTIGVENDSNEITTLTIPVKIVKY